MVNVYLLLYFLRLFLVSHSALVDICKCHANSSKLNVFNFRLNSLHIDLTWQTGKKLSPVLSQIKDSLTSRIVGAYWSVSFSLSPSAVWHGLHRRKAKISCMYILCYLLYKLRGTRNKVTQLITLKGLAFYLNTLSMVLLPHVGFVNFSLDRLRVLANNRYQPWRSWYNGIHW